MKTKVCNKCKQEKDINEFYKKTKNKDGIESRCKECRNKYFKKRYKKGRDWINNYKLQKGCQICGYDKCPEALVFHHKNLEDKEFTIGNLFRFSIKKVKREISKCVVLCCRCHRELHWKEKNDG